MSNGVGSAVPGLELPEPPVAMAANQAAAWVFTGFCAVLAVVVLGWSAWMAVRRRDGLPLTLMAGGAMCGLLEPSGDILGLTWHPSDTPLIAFTLLGRHIPAYVPIGEAMFFALGGYGAYRLFLQGRPVRSVVILMAAFSAFDAAMEMLATQFGVFTYYGDNPSRIFGLPLYALVQNGGLAIVIGWVALVIAPHLRGIRWLAAPLVVPGAFAAYVIACTWPVYLALNAQAPGAVVLPIAIGCAGLNFALPYVLLKTSVVDRFRVRSERSGEWTAARPVAAGQAGAA